MSKKNNFDTLGQRIVQIRKVLSLMTQEELEASSGVSQAAISRIESDAAADPGFFLISNLARALDVSLDVLADKHKFEIWFEARKIANDRQRAKDKELSE